MWHTAPSDLILQFRLLWMAQYIENVLKLTEKNGVYWFTELEFRYVRCFPGCLNQKPPTPCLLRSLWLCLILRVGFTLRRLCFILSEWLPHSSHQPNTSVPIGERQWQPCIRRRSHKINCDGSIWVMGPTMCRLVQAETTHGHGVGKFIVHWGIWAVWTRDGCGGTSLLVRRLRLCLPMQGMWV